MKVREEVTIGAASFKRPTDMLSSPLALFKGRLLMNLKISAQVTGLRKKGRLSGFNIIRAPYRCVWNLSGQSWSNFREIFV